MRFFSQIYRNIFYYNITHFIIYGKFLTCIIIAKLYLFLPFFVIKKK